MWDLWEAGDSGRDGGVRWVRDRVSSGLSEIAAETAGGERGLVLRGVRAERAHAEKVGSWGCEATGY